MLKLFDSNERIPERYPEGRDFHRIHYGYMYGIIGGLRRSLSAMVYSAQSADVVSLVPYHV